MASYDLDFQISYLHHQLEYLTEAIAIYGPDDDYLREVCSVRIQIADHLSTTREIEASIDHTITSPLSHTVLPTPTDSPISPLDFSNYMSQPSENNLLNQKPLTIQSQFLYGMDSDDETSNRTINEIVPYGNGKREKHNRPVLRCGNQWDNEVFAELTTINTSPTMQSDVFGMAYDEVKQGENNQLLKEIVPRINGRLGPNYDMDRFWRDDNNQSPAQKMEKHENKCEILVNSAMHPFIEITGYVSKAKQTLMDEKGLIHQWDPGGAQYLEHKLKIAFGANKQGKQKIECPKLFDELPGRTFVPTTINACVENLLLPVNIITGTMTFFDDISREKAQAIMFVGHGLSIASNMIWFNAQSLKSKLVSIDESLKCSYAILTLLVVAFIAICTGSAITAIVKGKTQSPRLFPRLDHHTTFFYMFTAIPVMVTTYTFHFNVHPIGFELAKFSDMTTTVRITLLPCAVIYLSICLFGYLLFGNSTQSYILINLTGMLVLHIGSLLNTLVHLGYALHVMLPFSLLNFYLRASIDELFFPKRPLLATDTKRFVILTLLLLVLSYVAAMYCGPRYLVHLSVYGINICSMPCLCLHCTALKRGFLVEVLVCKSISITEQEIFQVLIQWATLPISRATWEKMVAMRQLHYELSLEDKALFQVEGIDRTLGPNALITGPDLIWVKRPNYWTLH